MATQTPPRKKSSTESKDLNELLSNLDIGSVRVKQGRLPEPNPKFQSEIEKSSFKIFECIADFGYFAWKPKGTYKSLSSISSGQEVRDQIDLQGKPDKLARISSLGLPKRFLSLSPQEYENKYPYGKIDIACLHVAFQEKGVDHGKVDFAFGGSTLEMLATQDTSSDFLATKIPGTEVILIVKSKAYIKNYSDIGFQFERLMTGGHFSEQHDTKSVEHMHLMKVGKYRVLFRAEVDALHDGEPVEIKVANPAYYGTRVMFQMISNGSPTLCQGTKSRGVLVEVNLKSLGKVARNALVGCGGVASLENCIVDGMNSLKKQLEGRQTGKVLKVSFRGGSLQLSEMPETRASALLPPDNVVKELIL